MISPVRLEGATACSPDLDPIEMMGSKAKAILRKARARNPPDLLSATASASKAVTSRDAIDWFATCSDDFI